MGKLNEGQEGWFRIGDRVRFHKGGLGTVVSLKNPPDAEGVEQVQICCVQWDDWKTNRDNPGAQGGMVAGKNISISLPSSIYPPSHMWNKNQKEKGNYIITLVMSEKIEKLKAQK